MSTYTYFNIDQDSDFSVTISLTDTNGAPINLSSYSTYSGIIRKSYDSEISYSLDCSTANGPSGNLIVELSAANSSNMDPGKYQFDIILSNMFTTLRVVEGLVTINPSMQ